MRWLPYAAVLFTGIKYAYAIEDDKCWPDCGKPSYQIAVDKVFASFLAVTDADGPVKDQSTMDGYMQDLQNREVLFGKIKSLGSSSSGFASCTSNLDFKSLDSIINMMKCKELEWTTEEEEKSWRPNRVARFIVLATQEKPDLATFKKEYRKEFMRLDTSLIVLTVDSSADAWNEALSQIATGNRMMLGSVAQGTQLTSDAFRDAVKRLLGRWAGFDWRFTGVNTVTKYLNFYIEAPHRATYSDPYAPPTVTPQDVLVNVTGYLLQQDDKMAYNTKSTGMYLLESFGNAYDKCDLDSTYHGPTKSGYKMWLESFREVSTTTNVDLNGDSSVSTLHLALMQGLAVSKGTIPVIYALHPYDKKKKNEYKGENRCEATEGIDYAHYCTQNADTPLIVLGSKEVVEDQDLLTACPQLTYVKAETLDPATMALLLGEALSHVVKEPMEICGIPDSIVFPTSLPPLPTNEPTTEPQPTDGPTVDPPPPGPSPRPTITPTTTAPSKRKNTMIIGAAAGGAGLLMAGVAAFRMRQRSQNILGDEQYDEEYGHSANPDMMAREPDDNDFVIQSDELFQG